MPDHETKDDRVTRLRASFQTRGEAPYASPEVWATVVARILARIATSPGRPKNTKRQDEGRIE